MAQDMLVVGYSVAPVDGSPGAGSVNFEGGPVEILVGQVLAGTELFVTYVEGDVANIVVVAPPAYDPLTAGPGLMTVTLSSKDGGSQSTTQIQFVFGPNETYTVTLRAPSNA